MIALELQGVTYRYPGAPGSPALDGVSIAVEEGEMVVLAGASGSGKSTLLRAACGLVPHFHGGELAGRVLVCGMDTRSSRPGELAGSVGTLFQDPETQVLMGTARSELAFPLENRGASAAEVARGVQEAALALGIAHLLDRATAVLSGGELQRVALGAALAGRPKLILLDEPTSQLDPVAGDELIGLLRRINEDFGAAIVLAEHRLERCLGAADRVIGFVEGRVAVDDRPEGFLAWAAETAPELQTPGAKMLKRLGLRPVPGVKAARAELARHGVDTLPAHMGREERPPAGTALAALAFDRVWHELKRGPSILRGVSLTVAEGERVALMGRNGAGKSTLLRHAAGLMQPTRGKVVASGRVALLLQNPTDYLIHDRVGDEASARALATAGVDQALLDRHPRDISGGEKQRLALAIVLDDADDPAVVVCLDEPTRGMDRRHKAQLAELLKGLAAAVLVATHDPEFAAAFADRVVLLGDGAPIADAPVREILSGGLYFCTETARILGGAGGALSPEEGAALFESVAEREAVPA
ncbi:MAG: ATP-binding cassette domain-containing protein [Actinomycetota bacterium]|nr:ATP-binding cassette domain-containing protein [Actinomycetota bacterium]